MGARVIFESLRRRWRGKLIGLLAVACGIAILAALLALATDGGDKLASDVRGYGANLLVRPEEQGATIDLGSLQALKTIFWRNNIGAFAPDLTATVESDGGRLVL